ncbi:hypothetical protein [Tenacibaculum sp.]|uniref:hypothetical protein n=1 Tax=Tenacibaculum sp. TaxID=1906242 RepID=UPI003D151C31
MPTGYTAGIIDGTTETFQDFAKQCMRAFGATIHMRDESMDKEYEPRIPSDYHTKALKTANEKLRQAETLTDSEIIENRKAHIVKNKAYYLKRIEETKKAKERLDLFLEKAKAFNPPTKDHEGIAKFMIEQIETTIDHDGSTKYYDDELAKIDAQLSDINADKIRTEMIADAKRDIEYHTKEHNAELKRCEDSNKWVNDLLSVLT